VLLTLKGAEMKKLVSQITVVLLSTFGVATLSVQEASAFANRVDDVPNNQWSCGLCHINASGAGPRTNFGEDVFMFARDGVDVKWEEVCDKDSDGDGATNGAELGDPECAWRIGDADPDAMVTDPRDPESAPEGSAPIVGGEMMGGEMMGGEMMGGEMMGGEMMGGEMMGGEVSGGTTMNDAAEDEGGCEQSPSQRAPLGVLVFLVLGFFTRRRLLA
jgi:hypothetical protein